jgi:hypothetical protein
MNEITKYFYLQLMWIVEEINLSDEPETAEEAFDSYLICACGHTKEKYGDDAIDQVNGVGELDDMILEFIKIYEFGDIGNYEEIKDRIHHILSQGEKT